MSDNYSDNLELGLMKRPRIILPFLLSDNDYPIQLCRGRSALAFNGYRRFLINDAVVILFDLKTDYIEVKKRVQNCMSDVQRAKFGSYTLVGCAQDFNGRKISFENASIMAQDFGYSYFEVDIADTFKIKDVITKVV